MSWYSKFYLVLPALLSLSAFGQRIHFERSQEGKAQLTSQLVESRSTEGVQDIRFTFSLPSIDVDRKGDGFDAVSAQGLVPTTDVGRPALSTTGQLIAVPEGYEPKLTIVNQAVKELEDVRVEAFQRKFRCSTPQANTFAFDADLYASHEVYPAEVAKIEEIGDMQGLRLVRVAVNPIQMDMRKEKLIVSHSMDINVQFVKTGTTKKLVMPASFYDLAMGVAANANGLGGLVEKAKAGETLVVVVADSLKNAVQPLVQWKQSRGYKVKVATVTEAGATKELMTSYIKNYYQTESLKPSFLLFVGNKTTAPTYMEATGAGSAASDWRYALISGKSDRIPDMFYGRFVADNEAEVTTQVNRAIAYEKNPEASDWYSKALTIASDEGSGPSDKEYGEQVGAALKAGNYTLVDHFNQGDGTAKAANIIASLNEGRSWLAYFGHGSGSSWGSTNDTFSTATVDGLTNTRLPVIIDVACLNASWVNMARPFGKAWVTGETDGKAKGAVAYYGGSVSISWHPPAVMSVGIAKNHFEKKLETIGASVIGGQLHLFEKMGMGKDTLDNIKWYNLFGDPSLVVRTKKAKKPN